jgi:hypothetical protein
VKKLRQWVDKAFGRLIGRSTLRRILRQANLTWKKAKKLLGKAKPQKRGAHIKRLLELFAGVCNGEVILIYADEVHAHRDLDLYPIERLWDWMREDVTRGFCHQSVADLVAACQAFISRINLDPIAPVDRLWPKFGLDSEFEAKRLVSS